MSSLDVEVAPGAVLRPTARVLLIDDSQRLLLFWLEMPDGPLWFACGGGIDVGEDAEQAAVREVAEETGLAGVILGPEVWRRRHVWVGLNGVTYDSRERYFLVRVPRFDVDVSAWTDLERGLGMRYRWWAVDELLACAERFSPADLPGRVAAILRDGPPAAVLDIDGGHREPGRSAGPLRSAEQI